METNGLMFVRHVGDKSMLVAIINKPKNLHGEAQHEFIGNCIDGKLKIQTTGNVIDIREHSIGNTPDGLLQLPIWRT